MSSPLLQDPVKEYRAFKPKAYLDEYYAVVGSENDGLLLALADIYKQIGHRNLRLIEIGGGPTLYQLISAAPHVASVRFTDYSLANLHEISRWVNTEPRAFNWDGFIACALQHEQGAEPSARAIAERAKLLRSKITVVNRLNIKQPLTLGDKHDIISMHFVAESISSDIDEWREVIRNVVDGSTAEHFVMSGLIGADLWHSGKAVYAAAAIRLEDACELLESCGFTIAYTHQVPAEYAQDSEEFQGYTGLFTLYAHRATPNL